MASSSHNRDILSLVCYSALTAKAAKAFLELRRHFLIHKGPEFVAKRGKALLNIANLLRSGGAKFLSHRLRLNGRTALIRKEVVLPDKIRKEVIQVAADARIALDKQLLPYGVEGTVVRQYVEAHKGQSIRRISAVLRCYTDVFLKDLSKSQLRKSYNSINVPSRYDAFPVDEKSLIGTALTPLSGENPGVVSGRTYSPINMRGYGLVIKESFSDKGMSLHPFIGLPIRVGTRPMKYTRPASLSDLSGTSSYPYDLSWYAEENGSRNPRGEFLSKPFAKMVCSLISKGYIPDSLKSLYPSWEELTQGSLQDTRFQELRDKDSWAQHVQQYAENNHRTAWYSKTNSEGYTIANMGPEACAAFRSKPDLGKISLIQEGGAKGRIVCTPNVWIQMYMQPIHKHLAAIVKSLEEPGEEPLDSETLQHVSPRYRLHGVSCMFAQERGVYKAQVAMSQGKHVTSVDLSSATDRFPLKLQLQLLSALGMPELAKVYQDLRGPYLGLDGKYWYYQAGQPMGLYSSFPLFHLTHLSVLEGCCLYVEETQHRLVRDAYAVIGDDVLIMDDDVLQRYLYILKQLDVPVQSTKCFDNNLAEFAGFILTKQEPTSTRVSVFRPVKYHGTGSLPIMAVCYAIGARVRKWGHYWSRAYDAFIATLSGRSITFEPYTKSESDDTPLWKDCKPSSSYIGAILNELLYLSDGSYFPNAPGQAERLVTAWYRDRFALLKEEESLRDIGHVGIRANTAFDPSRYRMMDLKWKERFNPLSNQMLSFREFEKDPLVREYRTRISDSSRN